MDYKKIISEAINIKGVSAEEIYAALTVPAERRLGDFTLPCFRWAKMLKASPAVIAEGIKAAFISPPFISKTEAVGGYLNFYIDDGHFARGVVEKYFDGSLFGRTDAGRDKNIVIDYSSVNIAKPLHIGHLSTTAIGGALVNIFRHLGYNVTGINHLGDYGTQFGKLIAAYLRIGDEDDVKKRGVQALTEIYREYEKLEQTEPDILTEARTWSAKIERDDPEAVRLFDNFKKITLKEVKSVYKQLGIKFDSYLGESFFARRTGAVVKELMRMGLLEDSDGAKVVRLGEGAQPCLILRSDGASLYATRDLAAAEYRYKKYKFDKCLYVVAYQQNLHFKQFFKVMELMGKPWAADLVHVAFGMVSLEEGTISTREGRVVLLKDVLNSATEKARSLMVERGYTDADIDKVSAEVGTGAVIYSALSSARIKDIQFSYDKVLNFEGETAPYLQYTHARCCSVLKKRGQITNYKLQTTNYEYDVISTEAEKSQPINILLDCENYCTDEESISLLKALDNYAASITEAAAKYEPCVLSKQLIEIAKAYSKFYMENPILKAEPEVRAARLLLTRMTQDILKEGLALLLIKAPEKM